MTDEIKLTEAEVALAAAQEENQRLHTENDSLRKRVVLLRALLNRHNEESKTEETETEEKSDGE